MLDPYQLEWKNFKTCVNLFLRHRDGNHFWGIWANALPLVMFFLPIALIFLGFKFFVCLFVCLLFELNRSSLQNGSYWCFVLKFSFHFSCTWIVFLWLNYFHFVLRLLFYYFLFISPRFFFIFVYILFNCTLSPISKFKFVCIEFFDYFIYAHFIILANVSFFFI